MRLAIDAMGGDDAPLAIVAGAVDYARLRPAVTVICVGMADAVYQALASCGPTPSNITVYDAPEVIGMGEKITALREKPGDSMNVCTRLLKEGAADAVVLCGNTACSVAAAQLHLGRINGVKRAGILTPLPNAMGTSWVIDCGANATAKPEFLAQWAEMGSAFLECYSGTQRPRIGVLSIGTEEGKGDDLTARTHELLKATDLNVVGLVEGNHIFDGSVDVVVCDGFTGNVLLKSAEGIAAAVGSIIKEGVAKSFRAKIGAWLMKPAFDHFRNRTHWSKVGGALLAGVNGIVVIGHGRSNATAVTNALIQAERCVDRNLIATIREHLSRGPAAPGRRASFLDTVKSFFGSGGEGKVEKPEPSQSVTPPAASPREATATSEKPASESSFDHRGISSSETQRLRKSTGTAKGAEAHGHKP
ncbi:MAG: phosphate acyltransferase PlsX [Planctomycetota bacterium]|nr:MAG: phosphate acyltransferase PlsX [Planctomycetota bacterium]